MSRTARIIVAYGENSGEEAARSIPEGSNALNIVVNNGPEPWPQTESPSQPTDLIVIDFLDNPGYLPAVQRVLRAGYLDQADWVIISNADVETLQAFTTPNVARDVAVIGPTFTPTSKHWNPREPRFSRQIVLTFSAAARVALAVIAPWVNPPRRSPDVTVRPMRKSMMVHGSCFAIRKDVLTHFTEAVTPPRLFGEEVLLGWYLIDHGHRFIVDPDWVVEHHGAGSTSLPAARRLADLERFRSRRRILRTIVARKFAVRAQTPETTATASRERAQAGRLNGRSHVPAPQQPSRQTARR